MIGKLLKKELSLCLHPAAVLMIFLGALVLVPNYPYAVTFFYMTLGVFFICLGGRENHDITFMLTLPVPKRDAVTARFLLVVLLELLQMLLVAAFVFLHGRILPEPNAAGLDANLALIGEGFLFFGIYHMVYFPSYYKDVSKVGASFVKSSVFSFLFIVLEIVVCYTVPLFRDVLDTPDPLHRGEKLLFVLACFVCWLLLSFLALRISRSRFEKLDIR